MYSWPDLVGHDHRPAAFLVYCTIQTGGARPADTVAVSLATIAVIRGYRSPRCNGHPASAGARRLLDPSVVATTANPQRRIMRPGCAANASLGALAYSVDQEDV